MWITLCLFTLFLSKSQANDCDGVIRRCQQRNVSWIGCFSREIITCTPKKRDFNFLQLMVNASEEMERSVSGCRVHVPSSALQMSRGNVSGDQVVVVITVIQSSLFQPGPAPAGRQGRSGYSHHRSGAVLDNSVLVVETGGHRVRGLSQPVRLTFTTSKEVKDKVDCVFWQESDQDGGTGYWSAEGCHTNVTGTDIVCCCDHLSFFAVLVNPALEVEEEKAATLSYIGYVGSGLSILFTVLALIIYSSLRWGSEKTVMVHLHLAVALLCLHVIFLLCGSWAFMLKEGDEGWVCRGLGLLLHWSLLATFIWMALEGFHLYLLLVRVFNIYIKKYVLKLSLVAWGVPTLTVAICGGFGVYGKYTLKLKGHDNRNATAQLCWISSQFPQGLLVSYVTTVAFPFLVLLFNLCMVCLLAFKMWGLRKRSRGRESSSWMKMNEDNWSRLWKDGTTVLGLSCVLGLPWGMASVTYVSLPGIYVFTLLNSLQGLFLFLWAMALTCKLRSEKRSSLRDTSSQKLMTTSFNN